MRACIKRVYVSPKSVAPAVARGSCQKRVEGEVLRHTGRHGWAPRLVRRRVVLARDRIIKAIWMSCDHNSSDSQMPCWNALPLATRRVPVGEALRATVHDAKKVSNLHRLSEGVATRNRVRLVVQPSNEANAFLHDVKGKVAIRFALGSAARLYA